MEKILLVVDMQKDFVDGALGTKEAKQIVPSVCKKIKDFKGKIYVTKDTHEENYLNTKEGRNLPVKHCIKGTAGWNLDKEVKKALEGKNYVEIEKTSFGSIDLPDIIKNDINFESDEIEIVGLCTDICVVSNALILKAHFPENEIKVYSDCCAGVTVESHKAALETMKMCQIDVIS